MIELSRLRAFVTVARLESVSEAARVLHVSQSPLSRQIAGLEDALGVQLFVRHRQRLRLADAGRAFLVEAEALLESAATLERRARARADGLRGTLTIGYVPGAAHAGVIAKDLERLGRRAPDARIELRAMRSDEQHAALARGAIDVGYAHRDAPGSLVSEVVFEEPFVLAAPRGGPFAGARRAKELLGLAPLVTLPASTAAGAHAELLAACARVGVRPDVRIEAHDPTVVLALVGAGLGVSVVQASLRKGAPKTVRFLRLPVRFGLTMRVHRLVRVDAPPLARLLG